jgi:hypothetical protein
MHPAYKYHLFFVHILLGDMLICLIYVINYFHCLWLGVNQYIDMSIRIDIYIPGDTRYRCMSIFRYEVRFKMWVLKY